MAIIDTYRKNVIKKREEIAKLASDKVLFSTLNDASFFTLNDANAA